MFYKISSKERKKFSALNTSETFSSKFSSMKSNLIQIDPFNNKFNKTFNKEKHVKSFVINSECGETCKNLNIVHGLDLKIKELIVKLDKVEKINSSLFYLNQQKDSMYHQISHENKQLKDTILYLTKNKGKGDSKSREKSSSKYTISVTEPSQPAKEIKEIIPLEAPTKFIAAHHSNRYSVYGDLDINFLTNENFYKNVQIENKDDLDEKEEGKIELIPTSNFNNFKSTKNVTKNPLSKSTSSISKNLKDSIYNINKKLKVINYSSKNNNSTTSKTGFSITDVKPSISNLENELNNRNSSPIRLTKKNTMEQGNQESIKSPAPVKSPIKNTKSPASLAAKKKYGISDSPKKNNLNHYVKIHDLTTRNQTRKYKIEKGVSFLSLSDENLNKILSDSLMKELFVLTLSDDDFKNHIRNCSDEKLVTYSDLIGNIFKDYRNSIKLIKKIKIFLSSSTLLINTVNSDDSTLCLINTTCTILDCERTSLFVYDKMTDHLIVHSANGLNKSQFKVPKDKGIVGQCFKTGEKIIVEDAYNDSRFNKDVDLKTGFRTRNILCMPIKNNDGHIIGVIQGINKKMGGFTCDDEELIEVFSAQASAILRNNMNVCENLKYIQRLNSIINFDFIIDNITENYKLAELAEEYLMKCFCVSTAQFVFYNIENDSLVRITRYLREEKKKVGIINYVKNKKLPYGCHSVDDCEFYNHITDIDSGFDVYTFPILNEKHDLLAVVQMAYSEKLTNLKKPKEWDISIIDTFSRIISRWIEQHYTNSKFREDQEEKLKHEKEEKERKKEEEFRNVENKEDDENIKNEENSDVLKLEKLQHEL